MQCVISQTIYRVEQKLSAHQGGCYNITEAQAIMTELRNIQKSLSSGEKEKAELMQSLAKLKDDLTRLQLCESSPDVSTLSLPQEKLSTASQTDLSGEVSLICTKICILCTHVFYVIKYNVKYFVSAGSDRHTASRNGSDEASV